MFECGDRVVYGVHGVCTILCLENQIVNKKKCQYFVLEPLMQPGARFFVPVHNEAAVSKLRPVMDRAQLEAVIRSPESFADAWIPDENQRKNYYKELLGSGNRAALMSMVRTLHKQKALQLEAGKKFHLCDDNFLRDARKLLSSEFALVFSLNPEELTKFMSNIFENENEL